VPGSASNDILGRALAQRLSESLGQPIVADYRPGAAGNIGSALAAKAAPDGYTLLIGYTSSIMISPTLHPSPDYHPLTDLAPIARFAIIPYVLVVHPSVPATNLNELIALAKARPGQLNFASSGSGGLPHLAGELFKMNAHVDLVHVPYKGAALAANDLLGGHVQLSFSGITGLAPSIKAGKVRAIAVTTLQRSALLPQVATAHESGLPGFDVSSGLGILAPARTPALIVRRLYDEIAKVVNGADMKSFIPSQGAEPALMDPLQFGGYIKTELAKWARVIAAANVKPE
jgi:tripartite-type tricarboxylate transporter receptor subunit TctC